MGLNIILQAMTVLCTVLTTFLNCVFYGPDLMNVTVENSWNCNGLMNTQIHKGSEKLDVDSCGMCITEKE